MGFGPRLWLGCCGIYLQPSEPLKLLLIIFLAALLCRLVNQYPHSRSNNRHHASIYSRLQILIPTFIMTGVALLLLIVQRDLGTASIFIFIYAVMVYLATGWRWIPLITALILTSAAALGYLLFDVVRIRIEAWINPWLDPTGRSFQIVQSLMSVANGGVFGRGPGLGSPTLVPVSHSDFIFSAITEETGLVGALALLALLGLLVHRGVLIALRSRQHFPSSFSCRADGLSDRAKRADHRGKSALAAAYGCDTPLRFLRGIVPVSIVYRRAAFAPR